MAPPAPPRWLAWACGGLMLVGVLLFVGGPMLSWAVANAMVDARLAPEELRDPARVEAAYQLALDERRKQDAWVIPVGLAMTSMGTMGLLFVFVTRPLGSDLDDARSATTKSGE